ncbi:MAG: hypothetical protein IPM16_06775 [Chloroflexi bacterium]|nr:hypothetical protein [Chloroflexota bacterium]
MPLVDAQTLASIRRFSRKALNETCTIRRRFSGSDDGYRRGGHQTIAEGVACRLMAERERDSRGMVAEREAGRTFWRMAVAQDADLQDGDDVTVAGVRYTVVQLYDANTDAVFRSARLARIEEPTA